MPKDQAPESLLSLREWNMSMFTQVHRTAAIETKLVSNFPHDLEIVVEDYIDPVNGEIQIRRQHLKAEAECRDRHDGARWA
jgi:hypothetical protein